MKLKVDNERFRLRPVAEHDHRFLVNLHNDPEVLHNVTHPQPISMEHHLRWWEKVSHDHRQLRLVFEAEGFRAGITKFYDIDRANSNCVLGADLHVDFRGKGYAKQMWSLMLQKCFDEFNLYRVGLTTAVYNDVARHVYEGLGFKEEGRLTQSLWRNDRYHDQVLMYMLRSDWQSMVEER